jgi:hypothetical protein
LERYYWQLIKGGGSKRHIELLWGSWVLRIVSAQIVKIQIESLTFMNNCFFVVGLLPYKSTLSHLVQFVVLPFPYFIEIAAYYA